MSKIIYFSFLLLVIATAVLAEEKTCSPWLGYCQVYEDCCRDLQCLGYAAKCVPIYGIKIPGQDTRPIGPGPYPPKKEYNVE